MLSSNAASISDEVKLFSQRLLDESPVGLFLTDAEGNCLIANERWSQLAGLDSREICGQSWMHGICDEDRKAFFLRWQEAVRTSREWQLEFAVRTPRGRTTWILSLGKALCDEQGRVAGYLGFHADITNQKTVEDGLRACERRYSELLCAANAYRYSVEIVNGKPASTHHGPGCRTTTGYTADEYLTRPFLWFDMIHPEDRERVQMHIDRVMRNEPVPPIEHRILHKSGVVRWVRDTIVRHSDENGTLICYDGLVEDISERKRAEQRVHSVLESAPDAMVLVGENGRILFANAQTERHFGFRRQDLLDQPLESLLPERFRVGKPPDFAESSSATAVLRMSEQPNLVGLRKDGTEFAAEMAVNLIEAEEGTLFVAAIRDVSQRKQMEERLRANLEIESALASMLRLCSEPLPLEDLLGKTLELLFQLPWIQLESKGSIYLVERDSQMLEMKAQRGLTERLMNGCRRVPMGCCLCGRAARQRAVVFSDCVDERHERSCPDMPPHGHYCVPIISENILLGVINLYMNEGHVRNPEEEGFLTAAADVLAAAVKRRQAEEALRKSEERFDLAIRGTDAGIWDWDLRSNEVYFSPHWKKMLGYEAHEIRNRFTEWESRLHPDDRDRALETFRDYLVGKSADYESEHRLRHKDGSYRWILARGALVRDRSGAPYRMVGSHLDITERKRTERLMREREGTLIAAQRIQEHLLPQSAPSVPGYEIAGSVLPAEYTAGDYYDYLTMPDGSLGIVVGDVCGHGFSSALLTAAASAHLRSFVLEHSDMREILRHVNNCLCQETEEGHFVTLVFVQIELPSRRLKFLNLGHPSGFVLGASGELKAVLSSGCLPLAIRPEMDLSETAPIRLETGDIILLATDGIAEARCAGGELFGRERMLNAVRSNRHRRAIEIIRCLQQAVFDFTGMSRPQDDLTAVLVKVEAD